METILSGRGTAFIFTIISVLAINCWQWVLPNFDYDNSYSITAAKNLDEGHGYSIRMASPGDLSKSYFEPLNKWPPGYSILLVFIHRIFKTNWIDSVYILNGLGLSLLVLIFRKMLFQLEYPAWIVNLAVLFFGFLKHPFHYSYNADIFGLLFFLYGMSFLISLVKQENKQTHILIPAAFFLAAAASMKYLYIPLSFIPFVSLFVYGYLQKRKSLRTTALKGATVLMIMMLSLLLFQYVRSGSLVYVNPSKTGFFPEQLLWLAPVIPSFLMNLGFYNMQLEIHLGIDFAYLNIFWSMVNVFLIGWLIYTGYIFFRKKRFPKSGYRNFYLIHAVLFTITLFAYLFLLTVLKNKHYEDTFFPWVYVQELRYFAVFGILTLQFAIWIFWKPELVFNPAGKFIFRIVMVCIFFGEFGHGLYYLIKKIAINKDYGIYQDHDQRIFKSMEFTREELKKNSNLVFCSNTHELANMSSLTGVPVFYDLKNLKLPLSSSRPLTLLIASDDRVPGFSVAPLFPSGRTPDFQFDNIYFYVLKIPGNPSH